MIKIIKLYTPTKEQKRIVVNHWFEVLIIGKVCIFHIRGGSARISTKVVDKLDATVMIKLWMDKCEM